MITAEERAINDAFESILVAPLLGVKISHLKAIIKILQKLQNNESDNFNLLKISGQLFYDLNNFFSEGHFSSVVKCFELLIQKTIIKRVNFKDGPIKDLVKKFINILGESTTPANNAIFNRENFVTVYLNIFLHKKMTNELIIEASNQLYACIDIILKDDNKDRYPQMFKMLQRMLKANPDLIITAEKLDFWFKNIVPLLMDDDFNIQTECIKTLEALIPILKNSRYETHPNWTEFKYKITNDYIQKIGEISNVNENWYKIWSICFKLMGRDLLSQAKEINKFLRVVEVALRQGTPSMKTNAYKCWYTFAHTFIQYDELHGSKRVKLICTPFKAYNERTQEIFVHKFRVWWYVLCNLKNVIDYVDNIILPFFKFCFGPNHLPIMNGEPEFNRSEFPQFCQMSIVGMLNLLGEPTPDVKAIQEKLDISICPTGIITQEIFDKIPIFIINACRDATLTIAKHPEKQVVLATTMWKYLLKLNSNSSSFNSNFDLILLNLEELFKLIPKKNTIFSKIVLEITKIVCKHNVYFPSIDALSDTECVVHIIESTMEFILRNELHISEVIATQFIKNLMIFQANETPHFPLLIQSIIKMLYENSDNNATKYVAKCKLQLWSEFYPHIQKYLKAHANDFFREQQILNINQMLMVPLILVGHIKVDFMKPKWAILFQKIIKNNKTNEICNTICKEMLQIFETQLGHFDKLLEFFLIIFEFMDSGNFDPEESSNIIQLLDFILKKRAQHLETDDLKSIIDNLNKLFTSLNLTQISTVLSNLKEGLIKLSIQFNERKELKSAANEMKVILKSKFGQSKSNGSEIIQTLFGGKKKDENDGFVAIPSNWKLNPDKLTDHQKEKMKERRSDIPALYSNLSCSTESSSIKPWQPPVNTTEVVVEKTPPIKIIAEIVPGKKGNKRKYSISGRDEPTPSTSKYLNLSNKQTVEDEETSSVENDVSITDKNCENILANNNKDSSNKNIKSYNPYEDAVKLNVENRLKELNIVDEKKRLKVERELRKMRIDTHAGIEVIDSGRPRRSRRLSVDCSPKKYQKRRLNSNESDRSIESAETSSKNISTESVVNDSNEEIACSQDVSQSVFTKPKRISRRYSMFLPSKTSENEKEVILYENNDLPVKLVKTPSPVKLEKPSVPTFHMSQMVQITNPEIIQNLKQQFSPPSASKSSVKISIAEPIKIIEPVVVPNIEKCFKKISEMETEPNTEPVEIIEPVKKSEPVKIIKISEMETEPNTEIIEPVKKICKISEMETESNTEIVEPVEKIYKICEMETEPNTIDFDKSCNLSTISSSEALPDEKTAEFLNNTLNISPIKSATVEEPPNEDLTKNIKLTNGVAKETTLPTRITLKPIISSPVNRKKLSFPSESPSRKSLIQTTVASSPSQSRGQKMMEMMKISTSKCSTPIEPKKIENQNLLTFNKILPSPMASPASSILKANKRKLNEVEQNQSPLCQPDSKRSKRVSFNHPESVTREYIVVPEEKRDFQPLNRCLNLEEELDDDLLEENPQKISIKELLKHKSNVQLIDDDDAIRKSLGVEDGPSDIMPIDELNEIITPPLVRGSESRIFDNLDKEDCMRAVDALDTNELMRILSRKLNAQTENIIKVDGVELINAILGKI